MLTTNLLELSRQAFEVLTMADDPYLLIIDPKLLAVELIHEMIWLGVDMTDERKSILSSREAEIHWQALRLLDMAKYVAPIDLTRDYIDIRLDERYLVWKRHGCVAQFSPTETRIVNRDGFLGGWELDAVVNWKTFALLLAEAHNVVLPESLEAVNASHRHESC